MYVRLNNPNSLQQLASALISLQNIRNLDLYIDTRGGMKLSQEATDALHAMIVSAHSS